MENPNVNIDLSLMNIQGLLSFTFFGYNILDVDLTKKQFDSGMQQEGCFGHIFLPNGDES